jgi:hypothetical protein
VANDLDAEVEHFSTAARLAYQVFGFWEKTPDDHSLPSANQTAELRLHTIPRSTSVVLAEIDSRGL